MLRLLLVLLWILIFFIVLGIPFLLAVWLIGLFSPSLKNRLSQRFVVFVSGGITFLSGVKIVAHGLENIPADEPVLYISNHRSFYDIFTAYRYFPGLTACVAKIEWKKVPLLRQWMDNLHCIFLNRKNSRDGLKAIVRAAEELRGDHSIWICPEGTRSHGDALLPFHEGSFRAAFQSGRSIVPMTFTRTDDIFENHMPWVKAATVHLIFDKPVPAANLSRAEQKEVIEQVQQKIQERYNEFR